MKRNIGFILVAGLLVISQSCTQKSNDPAAAYLNNESYRSDIRVVIHLRGIDKCSITLCPLAGSRAFSPVRKLKDVRAGSSDTIIISHNYLPGEFLLSFNRDTCEQGNFSRYEKFIIVSDQDLELWINPLYGNDPDSTRFQPNEKENNAYQQFISESGTRRESISNTYESISGSKEYGTKSWQRKVREYESMRKSYNRYVNSQIRASRNMFVSQVLEFQKIPGKDFNTGTEGKKRNAFFGSLDEISFRNPLIIKTEGLNRWMDEAMKACEDELATGESGDSSLAEAGKTLIEKVRYENPLIYGWMADYFYALFNRRNFFEGIVSLQPYIEDPGCLTSYRLMVKQRSTVAETIVPERSAPDFHFIDAGGDQFSFLDSGNQSGFKLLLFWNTGCMKCIALTRQLYSWYLGKAPEERPAVYAVNLDEVYNIDGWLKRVSEMPEWEHMIDKGGIDSEAANAYGILTTPVLILINADTREIVALPQSSEEIDVLTRMIY